MESRIVGVEAERVRPRHRARLDVNARLHVVSELEEAAGEGIAVGERLECGRHVARVAQVVEAEQTARLAVVVVVVRQ